MNEQRLQAYLNLIQQLLNCPNGEEENILQANSELVDAGLVEVMGQVADTFAKQGEENNANWLRNLARQLAAMLGNPPTSAAPQKYFNFLMETLQKVSENPNPQLIYPFWAQNLDKLNENLARILDSWARETLTQVTPEHAYSIAAIIDNFSNLIEQFPLVNIAAKQEIAITGYEIALTIFTFEAFPVEWARTQNNLASAYKDSSTVERAENIERALVGYREALKVLTFEAFPVEWARTQVNLASAYTVRIIGERAENIKRALVGYREALKVLTFEAFPVDWAMTQTNLANTYFNSSTIERAENIERALACYQEALKVLTFEAFPVEWARTQFNLTNAYLERIRGERAENIERALAHCQEALKVYTPDAFPYGWAITQNNLALAYSERIRGERAENIERALAYYQEALKVLTFEAFPVEWARTQTNLANAYNVRIRGEQADNLERAIACCQEAMKVYTFPAFPVEWAITQNNLANAYSDRIRGEQADNLERAISCHRESLKIYTIDAFPYKWARTQANLGNAYGKRIKGEKAENLEVAIACFRESLKVYTPDAFPIDWARTQNNLGLVYSDRIKGEKADNLEAATVCYQESLKVRTPELLPLECLRTARNLGDLAFGEGNWQLAIEAYSKAIEAVELSRSWAMTPQSKQEVMEAAINVYHKIVQAYLNTKQIPLALEYVERSKTRNLVELMTTRDLKPRGYFPPAILEELDRLRHEIRTEQISLANQDRKYNTVSELGQPSQPSLRDRTRLKELQQELDELIERDISPIDPNFSLTQKVEIIPFSDIQSLIDEYTAIIEWYITRDKILTFLVTHHCPEPQVWEFSNEDWANLFDWLDEYIQTYYTNRQQWRKYLATSLPKLAEILHLDEILSLVPKECDRLILIPHRVLHILPLHALPTGSQNFTSECLLDLFPRGVQYAPSCQLLKLAQNQQRRIFCNLFAIQNPTEDLIYTDLEVETIRSFFPDAEVLAKQAASEASLKLHQSLPLANCVHFSCHATFNFVSPLESALVLSKDEANTEDGYLTLAEIFELSLQQCRLVTLSACETGLIDFTNISDEYIGLPSGFLVAGSRAVVSSLWTVNDLSTALLLIKFYENLQQQQMLLALALNQAQLWLRDTTKEDLQTWTGKLSLDSTWKRTIRRLFNKMEAGSKPFQSPYHWAAFTAVGE